MPTNKHQIIPAVYLLARKGDEVLLTRRFKTGYRDGFYSLPAGHLDGGETLMEAIIRETKEEIGVDVKVRDLKLVHVMNRYKANDGERIDFFFEATRWEGEPKIMEPDKCDDIRWVALHNLDEINLIPYVREMFTHLQNGALYSDTEEN